MKSLTIALWISLFALMSSGGYETADRSVDSVQFDSGTEGSSDDGRLDP